MMTPAAVIRQPATLITVSASTRDEYNDPTYTETETEVRAWLDREGDGRPGRESGGLAELAQGRRRALVVPTDAGTDPADLAIDAWSFLVVAGVRWSVIGVPWVASDPRSGAASHIECTVERTE